MFCVLTCRCVPSALGQVGVWAVFTGRHVHTHVFRGSECVYPHCQFICRWERGVSGELQVLSTHLHLQGLRDCHSTLQTEA